MDRPVGLIAWKEPAGRSAQAPPVTQHVEQRWREHHVPIFEALSLLDADHHAATVDIGGSQVDGFRDAQAGGIAGRQDRAVFGSVDAREKMHDFLGTEDHWELPRLLWGGDQVVEGPGLFECDLIEKPESADGDLKRTGCELSLAGQVHLVRANLVWAQIRRRPTEVPREACDVLDVGALRMRREISNLHVLEHALPKRGHRRSSARPPGSFQTCASERSDTRRSTRREPQMRG